MAGKRSKKQKAASMADSIVEKAVNRALRNRSAAGIQGPRLASGVIEALDSKQIRPYFRPGASRGGCFRVTGREPIRVLSMTDVSLTTALNMDPTNAAIFPRLSGFASSFQKFRFRKVRLMYRPTAPATAAGQVMMAYQEDPTADLPPTEIAFLSLDESSVGPIWAYQHTLFEHERDPQWYYAGGPEVEYPERHVQGRMLLNTAGGTDDAAAGVVYIEYDVEFDDLRASLPESVAVRTVPSQSLTGAQSEDTWCWGTILQQAGAFGLELTREIFKGNTRRDNIVPAIQDRDATLGGTVTAGQQLLTLVADYAAVDLEEKDDQWSDVASQASERPARAQAYVPMSDLTLYHDKREDGRDHYRIRFTRRNEAVSFASDPSTYLTTVDPLKFPDMNEDEERRCTSVAMRTLHVHPDSVETGTLRFHVPIRTYVALVPLVSGSVTSNLVLRSADLFTELVAISGVLSSTATVKGSYTWLGTTPALARWLTSSSVLFSSDTRDLLDGVLGVHVLRDVNLDNT